jgi:hypothetical protein
VLHVSIYRKASGERVAETLVHWSRF